MTTPIDWPWRVGTSVFRTIYACPPGSLHRDGEVLIGMMDTAELAADAVYAHNLVLSSRQANKQRREQSVNRGLEGETQ